MAFTDSTTLKGLATSFAYGGIPADMILKKYQMTDLGDSPDQTLTSFMRNSLMDRTVDTPWREEHFQRSVDDPEFSANSARMLSMRYEGGRSGLSPHLPDGTFLDFDGARPDPRGTVNLPNMRNYNAQHGARASMISFANDSSDTATSGERHPERTKSDLGSVFHGIKDRLRVFSESLGAFHTGSSGLKQPKPITCDKYETEFPVLDLADSCVRNRSDAVTRVSNDPRVAYRHMTPDHRVKSSHFAKMRAPRTKYSDGSSRYLAAQDHKMVYFDGKLIRRQLADVIMDLEGQNEQRMLSAQGARYSDSHAVGTRRTRLSTGDLTKLAMMNRDTQPKAQDFSLLIPRTKATKAKGSSVDNFDISQPVAASMASAARKVNLSAPGDLRQEIEMSMADYGLYFEASARKKRRTAGSDLQQREMKSYSHSKEEGKAAQQYAGIAKIKPKASVDDFENDAKLGSSSNTIERQALHKQRSNQPHSDFARDIREFGEQRDPAQVMSATEIRARGRVQAADMDMDFGDEHVGAPRRA
jgi:hypothetical protein